MIYVKLKNLKIINDNLPKSLTAHGRAIMTGEDEISVGNDRLKAKHIVLATGATPRCLDIPGTKYVNDSDHYIWWLPLSND